MDEMEGPETLPEWLRLTTLFIGLVTAHFASRAVGDQSFVVDAAIFLAAAVPATVLARLAAGAFYFRHDREP
jgi:hypothetical protein